MPLCLTVRVLVFVGTKYAACKSSSSVAENQVEFFIVFFKAKKLFDRIFKAKTMEEIHTMLQFYKLKRRG
jgi:hypothetical protein